MYALSGLLEPMVAYGTLVCIRQEASSLGGASNLIMYSYVSNYDVEVVYLPPDPKKQTKRKPHYAIYF
jgi:hypothetical protein